MEQAHGGVNVSASHSQSGQEAANLADANRQLTERSEAVALLKTIAVATNEASSVEAALQVALDEVCRHTGWPVGHVCRMTDDVSEEAPAREIWHLDDPERFATFRRVTETMLLPDGAGLPGRVVASGLPAWIPDVLVDPDFSRARTGEAIEVRAGLAVPLLAGQDVVGVLEFFSPDPQPVDQRLLDLVAQVGTELGRVAERKRAEDTLRHSQERTRSILAAATDAFIGMDEEGVITDWNGSAEAIFGWGRDEAVGRLLADTIVPAGFRQAHTEGLRRFLETGDGPVLGKRLELMALRRDGQEFPAELSIWHIASGGKHFFNAFIQDISERKRTEQALAEARDQAMEASRMKSQFLATMSHEIRTPMNGVIGLAELLLDGELQPEQRAYAESLHGAGEALLTVIDDILDFSKIEAGRLELEDVEFDPRHLVDEVVQLLAPNAHGKGLELVGACSTDLPAALRGDPGRLRQILVNLTSNAIKFTHQGEVVVKVDQVGASIGDWATVQLEVTDSGIGIDPADHGHVLEPFAQADASTTRRYGGTGLGLAICRQLAEAMGGGMTLESELGHGSTFRIIVPLGQVWGSAQPSPESTVLDGVRVLVVDDNATSRSLLESYLVGWRMRPEAVADGAAALELLSTATGKGDPFEVALVDMAMPGMDGLEVARRKAAVAALASTQVLMLRTGAPLDAETAERIGVVTSVAKPVVRADLHEALVGLVSLGPTNSTVRRRAAEPVVVAAGASATKAASRPHGRGRVLVVEDNPTNQMVAMGLLNRLGFDAVIACDGQQAVDAVAKSQYTTVLMDCDMPVMDGYAAAAAIRLQEAVGVRIPIVAMTASAMVGDRERCLAAGMDDYVPKPVRLNELDRVLSLWSGDPARS